VCVSEERVTSKKLEILERTVKKEQNLNSKHKMNTPMLTSFLSTTLGLFREIMQPDLNTYDSRVQNGFQMKKSMQTVLSQLVSWAKL
jgi:hypothetical protein